MRASAEKYFTHEDHLQVQEEWRPVNFRDFGDTYYISSLGKVKRIATERIGCDGKLKRFPERILKPQLDSYGYSIVSLSRNNHQLTKTIHKMVALTFIENPFNHPHVNHKDGDKNNNRVSNLEWCSVGFNNQHAYDIGLKDATGSKNGSSKLTEADVLEIRRRHATGDSLKQLASEFHISEGNTFKICKRLIWTHV